MDAVTCDIGGRRVLGPLNLVALAGPNGSGKTTLLQFAAGHRAPSSGSVRCGSGAIAMLDQHVAFLRADEILLEAMRRMNPGLTLNACPAALARFAFRNITAAKHCGSLSGGERMRAGLACILSAPEPPALLMLDEPTNRLDICSIEVLEAGLRDYRGALLVVSHDAVFLDEIGAQRSVFSGVIDPICLRNVAFDGFACLLCTCFVLC
ncbi:MULTISPECIES: ATP-binding cassette domain-containing protein [unclassified Pannonibacter]|uniref:ATP-binding cassette domain-containing protein n=1 Tax=unclassified Pannonibacter TaxID=2627228 RepID=UPI0016478B65|nr:MULTISPECIES: ATP-binding cassette domain-containing protein [unclassified Pannonibacter]